MKPLKKSKGPVRFGFWLPGLLSALMLVFLSGCRTQLKLTNQTFVRELGDDVFANPALYLDNSEEINLAELSIEPRSPGVSVLDNRFVSTPLDYLGVGEYDFVITDGHQEVPFVLKVKDTRAPVLKHSVDTLQIDWGSEINWDQVLGAVDLSGVYYEPPSDLSLESGEHVISLRIRDRFGNAITKQIRVIVSQ